jgi:hypothetical protein
VNEPLESAAAETVNAVPSSVRTVSKFMSRHAPPANAAALGGVLAESVPGGPPAGDGPSPDVAPAEFALVSEHPVSATNAVTAAMATAPRRPRMNNVYLPVSAVPPYGVTARPAKPVATRRANRATHTGQGCERRHGCDIM